jgi:hypothetical protein
LSNIDTKFTEGNDENSKIANDKNHLPSVFKSPIGERQVVDLYQRMLAKWPVEHQLLEIPTRHGKTFIVASGEKNTMSSFFYMVPAPIP